MFQPVESNVSFPKLEEEILRFWREAKIYEKTLEHRRAQNAPRFVFYEGPPTANGMPHPGHCLTRAIKDLFPRYRTMRGYLCERKAGWDTHGLPVEVEVCKELGIHSKEEIENYGIEPFIQKCQQSVWRYMQEWQRMTERIGFWVDLNDAYVTYHQSYVESVWWSLKQLFDRGLLYQGHKIVWWWAQGGTALSAGEVGQGYREVADPSVYVKFPLVSDERTKTLGLDGASLLVWTTTPWTLPSNQFAAVHPDLEYAVVTLGPAADDSAKSESSAKGDNSKSDKLAPGSAGGSKHEPRELQRNPPAEPGANGPIERFIVASALVETIAAKVKRALRVERTMKGSDLIGLRYVPPFNFYYTKFGADVGTLKSGEKEHIAWRVVSADFVTIDSGTGLVHQAPAFGEVDFDVLTKERGRFEASDVKYGDEVAVTVSSLHFPELINAVAPTGKFTSEGPEYCRGRWVKDCDKDIIHDLKNRGLLFHREEYRHEYPFCWRADEDPLIQYPRRSWFIKTSEFKEQMLANNAQINWLPEHIKDGRFGNFLESNVDWALSRERFWGTPLPIWVCEKTGKMEAVCSYEELIRKPGIAGTEVWDKAKAANPQLADDLKVHKPYIDEVTYDSPFESGARMKRVTEVIDCWYDSGAMPFAQWGYLGEHKAATAGRAERPNAEAFASMSKEETLAEVARQKSREAERDQVYEEYQKLRGKVVSGVVLKFENGVTTVSLANTEAVIPLVEQLPGETHVPGQQIQAEVLEVLKVGSRAKILLSRKGLTPATDSTPHSELRTPNSLATAAENFHSQFPADFISEAIDQTRGWFYSQLAISTLVFDKPLPRPFKNCIVLGLMLGEDGQKMSKSKRNYREPGEIFEKYGADALRWYFFATQPPWTTIRYSERAIRDSIPEFLLKLWHVYSFFVIYANIDGFDPAAENEGGRRKAEGGIQAASGLAAPREGSERVSAEFSAAKSYRPIKDRAELDRWIISELNLTARTVVERMDAYDNYGAAQRIIEFVDALSNWYVRRSRDRFWSEDKRDPDKLDAYWTLYECLLTTAKIVAPFVPFMAEAMWRNLAAHKAAKAENSSAFHLPPSAFESVHLADFPTGDPAAIDEPLSLQMNLVREIASLGLAARMAAKLKVRQPMQKVEVILADRNQQAWLEGHVELLKKELNVKQVEFTQQADHYITYTVLPDLKRLGPRLGKKLPLVKNALAKADAAKLLAEMEAAGKVALKLDDGSSEALDRDDLQVRLQAKPGWAAAQGKDCVVVLSTEISPELVTEGVAREIVHAVQSRRKDTGCEYTDRIEIGIVSDSAEIRRAVEQFGEYIKGETLATELRLEPLKNVEGVEAKLGEETLNLFVKTV